MDPASFCRQWADTQLSRRNWYPLAPQCQVWTDPSFHTIANNVFASYGIKQVMMIRVTAYIKCYSGKITDLGKFTDLGRSTGGWSLSNNTMKTQPCGLSELHQVYRSSSSSQATDASRGKTEGRCSCGSVGWTAFGQRYRVC